MYTKIHWFCDTHQSSNILLLLQLWYQLGRLCTTIDIVCWYHAFLYKVGCNWLEIWSNVDRQGHPDFAECRHRSGVRCGGRTLPCDERSLYTPDDHWPAFCHTSVCLLLFFLPSLPQEELKYVALLWALPTPQMILNWIGDCLILLTIVDHADSNLNFHSWELRCKNYRRSMWWFLSSLDEHI